MLIQVISLFPEMFPAVLETSMLFKAKNKQLVDYQYLNLRDFGLGSRKTVDDTPYGGGDGMLLRPEPLFKAIETAKKIDKSAAVILMTPKGRQLNQALAQKLASSKQGLIIVCGRYEGYDERVTTIVDQQISIGNYVLTGGELPAMVLIDSVVRLIPGVLGGANSAKNESFTEDNTLEHPQYTRPETFKGLKVPQVLLSGNHQAIADWRIKHSPKTKDSTNHDE